MQLQLEDLLYQNKAIQSAVELFKGQSRNVSERPLLSQSNTADITPNQCLLSLEQLHDNKLGILLQNNLAENEAALSEEPQICIEMETGTGKTLVYIRTLYELYQHYGYTKFIILVPSIAVKEGIINTLESFAEQLKSHYQHNLHWFEYDSKRLNQLKHFINDDQPQIMLTTVQAFTAEDRILNQTGRDDSIGGFSYLEALGQTRPIIIMDEPQEGMDTELAQKRLATLTPLFVFRYSATHKRLINRLYRLTPYDAYSEGLVKKIEVLSVAEINDEALLKIELQEIQAQAGQDPKAKLTLWHNNKAGFTLKPGKWLKVGDNLGVITNNISYQDFTIERIYKGLRDKNWKIHFSNGVQIEQNQRQGDIGGLFRQQLYWLISSHFDKQQKLAPLGIKCLSLVFIDKVDNYIGSDPLIKHLFVEEYQRVYQERTGKQASSAQIIAVQGYYFARTGKGEFTDNESAMLKNREIYDLILKDKQQLLSLDNPVEFIFSHSALGVGWDNPNIFNIATLNQTYSEIKKRQEIGRGLRICVNQQGRRIYDPASDDSADEINVLTLIPNESYETFALQYQAQLSDEFGKDGKQPPLRKNNKGEKKQNKLTRHEARFNSDSFRNFWKALARKTHYTVSFNEAEIIKRGIQELGNIKIPRYEAEIRLTRIKELQDIQGKGEEIGREIAQLKAGYSAADIVEEISDNASLSYSVVFKIIKALTNKAQILRNPPLFIQQASKALKRIELAEMLRTLSYHETGDSFSLDQFKTEFFTSSPVEPTPNKGIYDYALCDADSMPEHDFARQADNDPKVVCFLKLPEFYKIPTPIGNYQPDFGLVVKQRNLKNNDAKELYFVIETKSTNDLNDTHALTEDERTKIQCAVKHFQALGIRAEIGGDSTYHVKETSGDYLQANATYQAPVKDYGDIKI
jgi:type III restriction enzyme